MSKTIVATYENRDSASLAVDQLLKSGLTQADISVLMTDGTRGRDFEIVDGTKAAEGTGVGATAGGILGALAAGLTAVGTVASGGSLLAAGPLVAALAGAGVGGAAGGLLGCLVGLGVPEHEAKLSSEDVENGKLLVGANIHEDRAEATKELLKSTGACNIATH